MSLEQVELIAELRDAIVEVADRLKEIKEALYAIDARRRKGENHEHRERD